MSISSTAWSAAPLAPHVAFASASVSLDALTKVRRQTPAVARLVATLATRSRLQAQRPAQSTAVAGPLEPRERAASPRAAQRYSVEGVAEVIALDLI